jgi:hypothetical protein
MAVRTTMDNLIEQVRDLLADPAGASQVFSDQQIQDALDLRREDLRTYPLRGEPTFGAGQPLAYLDYYADCAAWEDEAVLQGGGYQTLTADTAEPLRGHWTFAAHTPPPVYATGKVYDLHGCAADLLRKWAAKEKLSFDFTSSQQQQFLRSQKIKQLLQMAGEYAAQAKPQTVRLSRDDETPTGADYGRLDDRGLPYGTGYTRA